MKKFIFALVLLFSVVVSAQKTLEFQKIQLGNSDQQVTTTVTLDSCMDVKDDYCVATIEITGNPKMEFTVDKTTIAPNGKLMLEMTSNYNGAKVDFEVNPEENVALFLEKERGIFAFFKKQDVNVLYQLKY